MTYVVILFRDSCDFCLFNASESRSLRLHWTEQHIGQERVVSTAASHVGVHPRQSQENAPDSQETLATADHISGTRASEHDGANTSSQHSTEDDVDLSDMPPLTPIPERTQQSLLRVTRNTGKYGKCVCRPCYETRGRHRRAIITVYYGQSECKGHRSFKFRLKPKL